MKNLKKNIRGGIAAISTAAMTFASCGVVTFANGLKGQLATIQDQANNPDQFSSITDAINKFAGNIIACILSIVVAFALISAAVAMLMASLGSNKDKEGAKGRIIWAIILIVMASPAAFFGIAGVVANIGSSLDF